MYIIVVLIAVLLGLMEWYGTRKTGINKFFPLLIVYIISIPAGSLLGGYLVALPLLMMLLVLALCEIEDIFSRQKQKMSEVERSRL